MRIAIIGSGISGMVAAHLLCQEHEVVVFEANDYVGGHTHTIDVILDGTVYPVDTGFIVFNEVTYPNFVKLLRRLGVPWKPSQMSFSVKSEKDNFEYSPSSLNGLFATRRNLVSPSFYRMIRDVFRFKKASLELLERQGTDPSLGAYLTKNHYSKRFVENFIMPMGSAIWSADPDKFWHFPARYFVEFFRNHGFLQVRNQPQWQVIRGGSKCYVEPLTRGYRDRIRLRCPVESVTRQGDAVEVRFAGNEAEMFDHVIIAAHSDQALAMLSDPSESEKEVLGAFPYQENETILHTDESLLPKRKACWASWNYHILEREIGRVALTYDMNILQGLAAPVEFCVSLNLKEAIRSEHVLRQMVYHHPVYTSRGFDAQRRHREISGANRTHFCGAYWGYGFHEDGVKSALAVCKYFGKSL
jgi:predicted NAD/FAD-binding protein